MVPILLNRTEINDAAWNRLVEKSAQCVQYAFTFYLDLVCEWKALVWPSESDYELIMPLPVRRKLGIEIVYQPHFCQYLGIFSRTGISPSYFSAFLAELNRRFMYISDYHFNPDNFEMLAGLDVHLPYMKIERLETHWLKMDSGYENIKAGYSSDRLNNLKRAHKAQWSYSISNNIHPLIYLFVNNHAGNIPGGVSYRSYYFLETIFNQLSRKECCDLWYAHQNGVIHAGILMIRFQGRAIFLFNAADDLGRKRNARTFLLDSYIRLHAGLELTIDFESPEKTSIASFYKSFGAEVVPFLRLSKNCLPFPLRQIQNWRKKRNLKTS